MTRKLLPYEHELVAQLGVTEEEYLDFLSVQIDYAISPSQRLSTPQCGPLIPAAAVAGTAAATAGAVSTASQANRANKEVNRQKSIAISQQQEQSKMVADEKAKEDAAAKAAQNEILKKQRAVVSADQTNKARVRGRRSLITGSERGVLEDEFSTKLGG